MDSWLIKIDAGLIRQVIIQGAVFLAFFVVVKVFFADKIKAILEQRKEIIEKDLSAATEAKANAEKLENEYAEIMKGAHDEKAAILHSAAEDGEQMKEKIVAEAENTLAELSLSIEKEGFVQFLKFLYLLYELSICLNQFGLYKHLHRMRQMAGRRTSRQLC